MQKRIEFSANSLLKLCTHYLQDHDISIPLDAELVSAGVSPFLNRYVMLEATSKEWTENTVPINPVTREPEFLHVRYEGRRTMSWGNDTQAPIEWQHSIEGPNDHKTVV